MKDYLKVTEKESYFRVNELLGVIMISPTIIDLMRLNRNKLGHN